MIGRMREMVAIAMRVDNVDIVEWIVKHFPNTKLCLVCTVQNNAISIAKFILLRYRNKITYLRGCHRYRRLCPISSAVIWGNIDMTKLLLRHKSKIQSEWFSPCALKSPIYYAVKHSRKDALQLLLNSGFPPVERDGVLDDSYKSCIDVNHLIRMALERNRVDIARMFDRKCGMQYPTEKHNYINVFQRAIWHGYGDVIQFILDIWLKDLGMPMPYEIIDGAVVLAQKKCHHNIVQFLRKYILDTYGEVMVELIGCGIIYPDL